MDWSTDQKGSIAESAIAHAAIKLGISVSKPLTDGDRYDLIFDLKPDLAYCSDLDRCFYFPIDWLNGRATIQLRLRAARNNQHLGVNWADEFAFEGLQSSRLGP